MDQRLSLPADLQHLAEKREEESRRKGQRRRKPDRRRADSGPLCAADSIKALEALADPAKGDQQASLDSAEQLETLTVEERRSSGDRREHGERRRKARRKECPKPASASPAPSGRKRPAPTAHPVVYVVDDDPEVRGFLGMLVRSAGLTAKEFASAEAFLKNYTRSPDEPRCLVLDAFLPGMSGLDLKKRLGAMGIYLPVIMISGHADIPLAVDAMSAGVAAFLEKPFSGREFTERVCEAINRNVRQLQEQAQRSDVEKRLATLSPREREVMELLVSGKLSKQIAKKFGICDQTVARHRLRVLEKMNVGSVAELVRVVLTFRLTQPSNSASVRRP